MLSGGNDTVWMEREHDDAVSWPRQASLIVNNDASAEPKSDANGENDISFSISPTFKSMLNAGDWYVTSAGSSCAPLPPPLPPPNQLLHDLATQPEGIITGNTLLLQQPSFTSSPSCFPSPSFSLDPSQSHHYLPPPKSYLSSLLSVACSNPYDSNACDYITDPAFLGTMQSDFMNFNGMSSQPEIVTQEPGSSSEFPALVSGFSSTGYEGYEGSTNPMSLVRRNKVLRPLETLPTIETSTTLFQKRAMLRQSSNGLEDSGFSDMSFGESLELGDNNWVKKRKKSGEAELGVGDGTFDVSGFSYDSEELNETSRIDECARIEGNNSSSNAKSKVTVHGGGGCDRKGKKKGMPAKNLMAERRRRKKLNDRLYMLRSVVPKISRMDRASILGDAIDYLKDLLQRINDVHNELEAVQPGSLMPTTSFDPLSPAPATLPCRVKEELSNSLVIPRNQTAKVEVQASEGRTVNIHMFCARRPGLLLSTLTSLNSLGLDIQQAVISCFNGFALDVFRAEQCTEGQDILPDQIKDVLLDSAGFHGVS